jgi:hypothetical protein
MLALARSSTRAPAFRQRRAGTRPRSPAR